MEREAASGMSHSQTKLNEVRDALARANAFKQEIGAE